MKIAVKFLLHEKKKPISRVRLWFHHVDGKPFTFMTGVSTFVKDWSDTKQRVKNFAKHSADKNQILDELSEFVEEIYWKFKSKDKSLSASVLKKELMKKLSGSDSITLFQFIEQVTKKRKDSNRYSKGTIKHYVFHTKSFFDFFLLKNNRIPDFHDIDDEILEDFADYMLGKGKSPNYVQKLIRTNKVFFNLAHKKGYIETQKYRDFTLSGSPVDKPYITPSEIERLLEYNFSGRMSEVRDIFVFGCNVGLRHSDLSLYNKKLLREENGLLFFDTTTIKTETPVVCPINSQAKSILEKYQMDLPYVSSTQKFNPLVRDICKIAGLDYDVQMVSYPGGIRTVSTHKKFELVSSHIMRRSFATNAWLSGVPAQFIMKITGHTTEGQLLKYIRASQLEVSQKASEYDFFK